MAKVLLVEDDNNLREIYQARLMAEGYDIVTAQNGEEALVVAKQNKPDLIISDVMMPRISGFEMLDILRNTNELKTTKVIMLTALGQEDDQKRANSLGANKYLVKSQVTLEDIVNAAKELLSEDGSSTPAAPAVQEPLPPSMVAPAAPSVPAIAHVPDATPAPAPAPLPTPAPAATPAPVPAPSVATIPVVPAPVPGPAAQTPAPAVAAPVATPLAPEPAPAAAPVPAPVVLTPVEPPAMPLTAASSNPAVSPTPVEQAVVAVEPAPAPIPATADAAAQGLEAEEAALQAQIANYAKESATPDPTAKTGATNTAADASNDQAIADAVKELNESTPVAPEPAPAASSDNASTPTAPETPTADKPVAPETATPPTTSSDNAAVAGKKIIRPISDPSVKPDLDALLAKEEAKNPSAETSVANGATVDTPVPAGTPGQSFDPNTSL